MSACAGGYVCESCAEQNRQGRDRTTSAVKLQQRSQRGQAQASRLQFRGDVVDEQTAFENASTELLAQDAFRVDRMPILGVGGEVVPEHQLELSDTLLAPDAVALDASAHRLDLVTSLGGDAAAMALDAAQTIGAANSIEKMFAHQLAMLHQASMQMMAKAGLEADPVIAMRTLNLGVRAAEVFQRGAVNLQKLRGGGRQTVRVEHVTIQAGGQSIVGSIQAGRVVK